MHSAEYSSATQVDIRPPISQAYKKEDNWIQDRPIRHSDQLQFNLHSPPRKLNLETTFQKPRPIIIEKLVPAPHVSYHQQPRLSSNSSQLGSISNGRLEFAMQLAKRDVKKLKSMLSNPNIDVAAVLKENESNAAIQAQHSADDKARGKGSRTSSAKQTVTDKRNNNIASNNIVLNKGRKQIIGKITPLEPQQGDKSRNVQLKFHKSDGGIVKLDDENGTEAPVGRELTEIKRLRRELQKHMKRLDSVLEQKSNSVKDAKFRGKRNMEEDEDKEKKVVRAEEQASRSARVLYMLQRKVRIIPVT